MHANTGASIRVLTHVGDWIPKCTLAGGRLAGELLFPRHFNQQVASTALIKQRDFASIPCRALAY
jgi:hypothetical protein